MLKLIFFLLLAANAALFAAGQGYIGNLNDGEREPARLNNQLNAKELKPLTAAQANAAVAAVAPPPPAPKDEPVTVACLDVGNFAPAEARRFEAQVGELELGDRQSRRNVQGQDISSYMVNIPPQGSKEAADRKAAELRARGVTNLFVMNDSQPMRWGISLGVFKSETAAQTQLATLVKQGVRGARVSPRYSPSKEVAYQFRDIGSETQTRLASIVTKFPDQQIRKCQ